MKVLPFVLALTLLAAIGSKGVEFNDATLNLLKSANRNDRVRFYSIIGKITPEENALCVAQMRAAWDFHKAAVARAATEMAAGQNSWATFLKERAEWREAAEELRKEIQTDWHKDARKVTELTRDMDHCTKLHERMRRAADVAEKTDFARLLAGCATLVELDQQIASATGAGATFTPDPLGTLLRAAGDSPDFVSKLKSLGEFRATEKQHAEAEAWNSAQHWATAEQKRLAAIINRHRAVVDYPPLRLDEKLCAASTGHSREMVALKYFAHESPVEKNRLPGDRAKNAGFDGFASGECIFAGNRSPEAAYGAWWGSDGHRFTMFLEGANTMGAGNGGSETWTFNTANKQWPAPPPTTPFGTRH